MAKPTQYLVDPPPVTSPIGKHRHSVRPTDRIRSPSRHVLSVFLNPSPLTYTYSFSYSLILTGMDVQDTVQLTDSLHKLKVRQEANIPDSSLSHSASEAHDTHNQQQTDDEPQRAHSRSPQSHDGYGFKKSGINTPFYASQQADPGPIRQRLDELLPDSNGLGWPGKYL